MLTKNANTQGLLNKVKSLSSFCVFSSLSLEAGFRLNRD